MFQVQIELKTDGQPVCIGDEISGRNYEGAYANVLESYTIDMLITDFIKECKKKAKSSIKEDLEKEIASCRFLFKIGRESKILGEMAWFYSPKLNRAILFVIREDRNNNLYMYNLDGQLVSNKQIGQMPDNPEDIDGFLPVI